jgi:hypothetical protein
MPAFEYGGGYLGSEYEQEIAPMKRQRNSARSVRSIPTHVFVKIKRQMLEVPVSMFESTTIEELQGQLEEVRVLAGETRGVGWGGRGCWQGVWGAWALLARDVGHEIDKERSETEAGERDRPRG